MHDLKFWRIFEIDLPEIEKFNHNSTSAPKALHNFHMNLTRAGQIAHAPGFSGLLSAKFANFCNSSPHSEIEADYIKWLQGVTREDMLREIRLHAHLHEKSLQMSLDAHKTFENLLRTIVLQVAGALEVLLRNLYFGALDEAVVLPSGSAFKPSKRPGFGSRDRVRETFGYSFACPELNQLLEDPVINAVALLRNIIAHNAAVADEKFIGAVQSPLEKKNDPSPFLDRYSEIQDGAPVEIDAEIVLELVEGVAKCGYDFAGKIDKLLIQP